MNKNIVYFFFLLIAFNLNAQQNTFSKVLASNGAVQLYSMVPTIDSNYIYSGRFGYIYGLIAKCDKNGEAIWSKRIENYLDTPPSCEIKKVIQTKDSCFLAVSDVYSRELEKQIIVCLKFDTKGDTIWTCSIINEIGTSAKAAFTTLDGSYLLVGYQLDWNFGVVKPYISKIDSNGTFVWGKLLETFGSYEARNGVQLADSSMIISLTSRGSKNNILCKLTKYGDLMWTKSYSSIETSLLNVNDFLLVKNGMVASVEIKDGFGLVKFDVKGDIIWKHFYKKANLFKPTLYAMNNETFTVSISNWESSTIANIDTLGRINYAKEIQLYNQGIIKTPGNEVLVYGNGPLHNNKKSENYETLIGIIQLDSSGNTAHCISEDELESIDIPISIETINIETYNMGENGYTLFDISTVNMYAFDDCMSFVESIDDSKNEINHSIFPNPNNGEFNVNISNNFMGNFILYNALGQQVFMSKINKLENHLILPKTIEGIFFYKIENTKGKELFGKLIIKK